MAKYKKKPIAWYTTSTGKHVPIFEGETKADAVKRMREDESKDPANKVDEDMIEADNKRAELEEKKKIGKQNYELQHKYKDADGKTRYQKLREKEDGKISSYSDLEDAVKNTVNANEDAKEKQIAENKKQTDNLNSNTTISPTAQANNMTDDIAVKEARKKTPAQTYKNLGKAEQKKVEEYIKNTDWVHEQVNRELSAGKDWDTIMGQVYGIMKKKKK